MFFMFYCSFSTKIIVIDHFLVCGLLHIVLYTSYQHL
nr:MAG TPA: hypothetical protein [Caudoviricetes sp.]DAT10822.1 MAG TPA: hypothetical protein [Caudoviricetes sp.]DAU93262.1 MAG TPA: hypothetical protein [Caudoviricetes sp.]